MSNEQDYDEWVKSQLSGIIENESNENANRSMGTPVSNISQPQQYPQTNNQQSVSGNGFPCPQPGYNQTTPQPQNQQAWHQQSYAPAPQPTENTVAEFPVQTVNISNLSNTFEDLGFYIQYEPSIPAMYLCKTKASITTSSELQDGTMPKITNKSDKGKNGSREEIASGCAQFSGLIEEISETSSHLFCVIQVNNNNNDNALLRFPVEDISNHNISVKKGLADHRICFSDTKYFKMWCLDIARKFNYAIPIKKHIGFYEENGIWRCAGVDAANSNLSGQIKAVAPFLQSVDTYSNDAFEELTLVLYGLISKMFTVLKAEEIPEFAQIILANPDVHKLKNALKKIFSIPETGIFDDYAKSLKELPSCKNNSTPVILLSDKAAQNKTALDFVLNQNNLNCYPLLITKSFDHIYKCDDSQNYLLLKMSGDFTSDISKIIGIFLCELLAKDDFVQELKFHMQDYSSQLSDSELLSRVQNLYSLMLALIKTIFTRIGCSHTDELCKRYCQFLVDGDSVKNIDIEKLRYTLTSDIGLLRTEKKGSGELFNNYLYFSKKAITLNAKTMSFIGERFGYSKPTTFSAALKANDLLDSSEKSNSKVVNLNGNSVRAYSFSIEKVFPFGDFIPDCQENPSPLYSIPIGSLGRDRTISFSVSETSNNSMYVSGQSCSGKTHFCNILAKNAAEQKMSVIIIEKNSSKSDLCSDAENNSSESDLCPDAEKNSSKSVLCPDAEKIIINSPQEAIRWNEIIQKGKISKVTSYDNDCDSLLKSFYEFCQNAEEKIHTLLILDEAQRFNWNEKFPLREILRQGRHFGISLVLSTHYVDSNLAPGVSKALDQCASFCFFSVPHIPDNISKKYPLLKDAVRDLKDHKAFLVGHFSVNGVPCREPICFKAYKS